ncbi:MAG: histidine phosphatase family protein [Phormidesmis sp.]
MIVGCGASTEIPDSSLPADAPLPVDETTVERSESTPELASTPSSQPSEQEALWAAIAQADETYGVLLRHAIAPGTGDPASFQLDDCATQRNLSEAGRQQARKIGSAFLSRNIPITKVLSSQWCRCLETAQLMNVGPVEPFPALNSFFRDRSTAAAQTTQVKDYIAANSDSPGVIIMVTHQVNITALSDIFPPSGSAVVVQLKDEQLEVVGQLLDSDL